MQLSIPSVRYEGDKYTCQIRRTHDGWWVQHSGRKGDCDPYGLPYLFEILDANCVHYPEGFDVYFWHLWEKAKEENLSDNEIQEHLNTLGEWLKAVEAARPQGEFWRGIG